VKLSEEERARMTSDLAPPAKDNIVMLIGLVWIVGALFAFNWL